MTNRPGLLLYCQHSLGLGHLKRSWALAAGLAREFRVVLVSGGATPRGLRPPDGVETRSLPALAQQADGRLFVVDGSASVEDTRTERIRLLEEAYDEIHPKVIVVELFPFGRKKFTVEIMTLIERARRSPGSIVATSVRDLLVDRGPDQPMHDERARQVLEEHFDTVLVHADPQFATLTETFRPATPLTLPVHHTGFVVDDTPSPELAKTGRILVSAGGGRFGETLYRAAIDAHRQFGRTAPPMTIVGGPLCPNETLNRLRSSAGTSDGISIVSTVADLSAEMRASAVSVSQCGYNTALDILRARVPAVVVPFAENGDSEQTDRAQRLERLGAVQVLDASRLETGGLAEAIRAAFHFVPGSVTLNLDGAATSARILSTMCASHVSPLHDEVLVEHD